MGSAKFLLRCKYKTAKIFLLSEFCVRSTIFSFVTLQKLWRSRWGFFLPHDFWSA